MTVANDQPDWTGTVTNTPDARIISTGINVGPPVNVTPNLLATDRSLVIVANAGGAGVTIGQITGNSSGIDWSQFDNIGAGNNITGRPVIVPVWGVIDDSIHIVLNSVAAITYAVVASPDQFAQGTPSLPVTVAPYLRVASTAEGTATGTATTHLLAAPPAGFGYAVKSLNLFNELAATAAFWAVIQGATSAVKLLGAGCATGGFIAKSESYGDLLITEGLDLHTAGGGTAVGSVFYDLVELAF